MKSTRLIILSVIILASNAGVQGQLTTATGTVTIIGTDSIVPSTNTYDFGTVTVLVGANGTASTPYGNGGSSPSGASDVANGLCSAINSTSGTSALVRCTGTNGGNVNLAAQVGGAGGNSITLGVRAQTGFVQANQSAFNGSTTSGILSGGGNGLVSQQPNLLTNGSFESGSGGGVPTAWTTEVDAGSATQTWTTSTSVSATHSVQTTMVATGQADWRQLVSSIDPTTQYRVRAHVLATNVAPGSHSVEVQWFAGLTYLGRATVSATMSNIWQEVKAYNLIPPAGTTRAWILLRTYSPGTYNFDDIVFSAQNNDLVLNRGKFPLGVYAPTSLELLSNTNFEMSATGILPSYWTFNLAAGSASSAWDRTKFQSPSHSATITVSAAGQSDWRQLATGIDSSLSYSFSGFIYATNVNPGSHAIELQWFDANNNYLGRSQLFSTTANAWVEVKNSPPIQPSGATQVWVLLRAYQAGTYSFDDVSLQVAWSTPQRYADLLGAGFNFLTSSGSSTDLDSISTAGLDAAYVLGNYMFVSPNTYSTALANAEDAVKAHPAVAFWQGPDEPAWQVPPPPQQPTTADQLNTGEQQTIQDDINPRHLIWVNHAPRGTPAAPSDFSQLGPWSKDSDLLSIDIYPVPEGNGHCGLSNQTISCVGNYVDILFNNAVCVGGIQRKPIWMVLQGFGWPDIMDASHAAHAIELQWFDAQGHFLHTDPLSSDTPGQWTRVQATFIPPSPPAVPALPATASVLLRTYYPGSYWFDDVTLQKDLVNNGSFEAGGAAPQGWSTSPDTNSHSVQTWDTALWLSSNHSAKTTMNASGQADWRELITGIDPNAVYNLSGFIYATNVIPGSHSIELQWFDANNNYLGRNTFSSTTANAWVQVQGQNIAPLPGSTQVYVLLRTYAPGTYWFDDISLLRPGANLLANSNFESGSAGLPAAWTTNVGAGTATQIWTTSAYVSPTHSVETVMSSNGQADWRQQSFIVDPAYSYTLSGFINASQTIPSGRPTWLQTRFMAYDAIIHGARGIAYWGNHHVPVLSSLWGDIKHAATELNSLTSILSLPLSFRSVTTTTGIEAVWFDGSNGTVYLVAANNTGSPVNALLSIDGLPLSQATEFFEGTPHSLSGNTWNENFSAYQVHVYQVQ